MVGPIFLSLIGWQVALITLSVLGWRRTVRSRWLFGVCGLVVVLPFLHVPWSWSACVAALLALAAAAIHRGRKVGFAILAGGALVMMGLQVFWAPSAYTRRVQSEVEELREHWNDPRTRKALEEQLLEQVRGEIEQLR